MYDGIKVFFRAQKDLLRRILPRQVLCVSEETGEIICHTTTYRNIHVHIYDQLTLGIKLHGSLHKFFCKTNDTLFSYEDVCLTVKDFAATFGIKLSIPCVQSLEIGVNIPVDRPEEIINAAILYHGSPPSSIVRNNGGLFKTWEFKDYSVKLYTKGTSILRFEFHYHRLRKLKGVRISSLADLIDRSKFLACLQNLYYFTKEFLFVPSPSDALPSELERKWAIWRSDNYWISLDRSQKSREKARVNNAIASFGMEDWRVFLQNAVLEQGAQMLGTTVKDLDATFSTFRLSPETVADPIGDCDRQIVIVDVQTSKVRVALCQFHSVRNDGYGYMPHVARVYRDVQLGGRGPPDKCGSKGTISCGYTNTYELSYFNYIMIDECFPWLST